MGISSGKDRVEVCLLKSRSFSTVFVPVLKKEKSSREDRSSVLMFGTDV